MSNSDKPLADLLIELRRLLEEERKILLSGHPARLACLVERKLRLADAVECACSPPQLRPSRDEILWLATYNRGNSVICSALLRHLTRTMDALRRDELHRSYGPDGAETSPPAQTSLGAA